MKTPGDDASDEILELSLRISDHRAIDWSATKGAVPHLEATLKELEKIQSIAELHRDPSGREADGLDSPAAGEWGPLRLIEKLGEGGFGEVWRARDPALQRNVALKLSAAASGVSLTRWLTEARLLARVRHPNVIAIHGVDRHDERTGIWMDLVEGLTLEELLQRIGPLGAGEVARIGIDLCSALSAVHAAGLVHGDIKPRNIMRAGHLGDPRRAGQILLMDFGSAQASDAAVDSLHTPLYAAPELLDGDKPTRASDIYSVGVVLYRLLTGRFPFEADSVEALRDLHRQGSPVSLRDLRPGLPAPFISVVETALSRDPALRFQHSADMSLALASGLDLDAPVGSAPRKFSSLLLAGVLGVVLGAFALWSWQQWPEWTRTPFRVQMRGQSTTPVLMASVFGEHTNDALGAPLWSAGDVDRDGLEDFLIAAPHADNTRGSVILYRGVPRGTPEAWLRFNGDNLGEAFGSSISTGDLNGDGFLDVVVGAPQGSHLYSSGGRVYVWFGGPDMDTIPDLMIEADYANQSLGYDVDSSGDLDGDGFADLCVGAPLDERAGVPTGRAFVYRGGPEFDAIADLDLTSGASYSQFGVGASTVDLNGDSYDDLVISANWENTDVPLGGRVYIYLGGPVLDSTPDLIVRGPHENAILGAATSVGDVNGDGFNDLGMQVYRDYSNGILQVRILFGGERLDARFDLMVDGPEADGAFGSSFGPAGDANCDGFDDFFVGAPSQDEATRNAGALFLYFGGPEIDPVADLEFPGHGTWDLFGSGAAPVPDQDGDGCGGIMIGSRWASDGGRRAGRVDWFEFRR